jgi:hypothetical protein
MQKAPSGNGTLKLTGNIINTAANKPVSYANYQNKNLSINQVFLCFDQPLQQQPPTQQYSSNIPTHKPNNFQQTLPRYNPPPQLNPARRLVQRGRYSTGTTSLIPAPGSQQQHHPSLISPALSTTSSAQASVQGQDAQPKSGYPSRIPNDMLKFQVRKSDADAAPPSAHSHGTTNAQIQVSQVEKFLSVKEKNSGDHKKFHKVDC